MVSIGTVFSLAAVGAVIAGGFALYSNRDKIGSALSRGVETNLTNPLGNYFDNLWKGTPGNGNGTTNSVSDVTETNPLTILNPLPTAHAQLPTGDTAITPEQATAFETKYLPKATQSANRILQSFSLSSQKSLIEKAAAAAKSSPTPKLTTQHNIVDLARVSVGGVEPLKNKFYSLFNLNNTPYGTPGKVLPLSKQAVSYYSNIGVIAREVYL